jgi:hypothetical protein
MMSHSRSFVRAATVLVALGAVVSAFGQVRSALSTPGKEYTDLLDQNAAGGLDATRNVHWYGDGTTNDSFKYQTSGQVDGLASPGDAFYFEVINNQAALLISVQGDHNNISVYAEDTVGNITTWATKAMVNSNGVDDLDALECWGGDPDNDAYAYSLMGDGGDAAVLNWTGVIDVSTVAFTRSELALAIGLGRDALIDVDAFMMFGENLLFSIRPFAGFDGGEIWTYTRGVGASFLQHGGHTWDTAFNVSTYLGCPTENIDGLEAVDIVPEPASMIALGLGAAGLLRRRAKKA